MNEMASDRRRPAQPLYREVERMLEERLASGAYPVGSLMPTEAELAGEFSASRFTIREALRQLAERGFVERRQGLGTRVVAARPEARFVQSFGSLGELIQLAAETFYGFLGQERATLDAETAADVGGRAGETWLRLRGVRWTEKGGVPICHIVSYVPLDFVHLAPEFEATQGPFFTLIERHAEGPIEEIEQEIRAVAMPAAIASPLGREAGAPSLRLLRRYRSASRVLIASYNWHPAERMTYSMRIRRAPAEGGR